MGFGNRINSFSLRARLKLKFAKCLNSLIVQLDLFLTAWLVVLVAEWLSPPEFDVSDFSTSF